MERRPNYPPAPATQAVSAALYPVGATLFFYCSNTLVYLVHYQIIDLVWRWGGIDKIMGMEMNGFSPVLSINIGDESFWSGL